jgi:hypothetical protein
VFSAAEVVAGLRIHLLCPMTLASTRYAPCLPAL